MDFERDRKCIWDGAPWTVSKHVVLDDFDMSMKPSEIKFKRLPIWFRCDDLPFNLMNKERGKSIAEQVGEFISLDLRGNGSSSGWGMSLRARVWIDLDEPLMRGFPIESKKRKMADWYPIQYERLPYFYFSCGRVGHSEFFAKHMLNGMKKENFLTMLLCGIRNLGSKKHNGSKIREEIIVKGGRFYKKF